MPRPPARLLPFREKSDRRPAIGTLMNLGPRSSQWLAEAGVTSIAEIRRLGPVEVCRRVRARGRPVSVLLAYALEGGLAGCHWNEIPAETKRALQAEFAAMKRAEPA